MGHRQEETILLLPEAQDRDDVRMVEASCDLRFPQEPLPKALVLGEFRREELERDRTPGCRVPCQIDGAHCSLADEGLHAKSCNDRPGADRLHR